MARPRAQAETMPAMKTTSSAAETPAASRVASPSEQQQAERELDEGQRRADHHRHVVRHDLVRVDGPAGGGQVTDLRAAREQPDGGQARAGRRAEPGPDGGPAAGPVRGAVTIIGRPTPRRKFRRSAGQRVTDRVDQFVAGPGHPGTDGAHRHPLHRGGLGVRQAEQLGEHERRAPLGGQPAEQVGGAELAGRVGVRHGR